MKFNIFPKTQKSQEGKPYANNILIGLKNSFFFPTLRLFLTHVNVSGLLVVCSILTAESLFGMSHVGLW